MIWIVFGLWLGCVLVALTDPDAQRALRDMLATTRSLLPDFKGKR